MLQIPVKAMDASVILPKTRIAILPVKEVEEQEPARTPVQVLIVSSVINVWAQVALVLPKRGITVLLQMPCVTHHLGTMNR